MEMKVEKKRISRRDFLRASALTTIGVALVGCSKPAPQPAATSEPEETAPTAEPASTGSEPIEITMWHGWTGADNTETMATILDGYNESNEQGITVNVTAYNWDEFFAKWVMATASGNPPDVALYHPTEVPEMVERGTVLPMDDFLDRVDWSWEGIASAVKEQCYYEGTLWGIVEDMHPFAMYYNVDLVEAAGLDPDSPPTNREEYLEWVEAMTIKDANGNFTQIGGPATVATPHGTTRRTWHTWLHQAGTRFIEDNKAAFNNDAGREATQFMYDMLNTHEIGPKGHDDFEDFRAGIEGICFNGPWNVNAWTGAGLNIRTAPMPACFKEPAAWCNSHIMSLSPTDSPERQLAGMRFIKYFVQNNLEACVNVGLLPVTPEVMEQLQQHERWQYYKAFAEEAEYLAYEPLILQYTQVFTLEKPTPLTVNLEAAISGEKAVEEALDDMEKGINEILETPLM